MSDIDDTIEDKWPGEPTTWHSFSGRTHTSTDVAPVRMAPELNPPVAKPFSMVVAQFVESLLLFALTSFLLVFLGVLIIFGGGVLLLSGPIGWIIIAWILIGIFGSTD
jgi:hypothetical protein